MAVPTLSDARSFFASDIIITAMSDARLNYWITDLTNKAIVDPVVFDTLYFNAFLNLLGHYLYIYETNYVSINGPINSETTAQVSRSFESYKGDNPLYRFYSTTKYGMIFWSLQSMTAQAHGGVVAACGYWPVGLLI